MIVSHKHQFIFIKTRKTAGTSMEIALSEFCGPADIITTLREKDEKIRQEMGFRGPQNDKIPVTRYRIKDYINLFRTRKWRPFYNHIPANLIRRYLGADVWDSYYKFCFERNPYDKAISRYYWSTRDLEEPPGLTGYLETAPERLISNWDIYTINDEIAVDYVGRFENLNKELGKIGREIGLPGELTMPKAKSGYRSDKRHYSEVLDLRARRRIEDVCAKEIEYLSYEWEMPTE